MSIGDEDILSFEAGGGLWGIDIDGSEVGLNNSSSKDSWGAWTDRATGDACLTSRVSFSVSGVSRAVADVFVCAPGSVIPTTTCTFSMFWDGSDNGWRGERMDGLSIQEP